MVGKRKRHSPEFKAKIALLAIKGEQRINEIASRYQLHPGQVIQWKKQLLAQAPELFSEFGGRFLPGGAQAGAPALCRAGDFQ